MLSERTWPGGENQSKWKGEDSGFRADTCCGLPALPKLVLQGTLSCRLLWDAEKGRWLERSWLLTSSQKPVAMKPQSFQICSMALSRTVFLWDLVKGRSTCEERNCWFAWELLMPPPAEAALLSSRLESQHLSRLLLSWCPALHRPSARGPLQVSAAASVTPIKSVPVLPK